MDSCKLELREKYGAGYCIEPMRNRRGSDDSRAEDRPVYDTNLPPKQRGIRVILIGDFFARNFHVLFAPFFNLSDFPAFIFSRLVKLRVIPIIYWRTFRPNFSHLLRAIFQSCIFSWVFFQIYMGMLTNLIYLILENFTNSDRTPPYIDTYLQLFPNFGNYGKKLPDKNEP